VDELSDFFLESGFGREREDWGGDDLQALHDAILEALLRRGLLSPEALEKIMADRDTLDQLLQKTVERLVREGYLQGERGPALPRPDGGRRGPARPPGEVRAHREDRGLPRLPRAGRTCSGSVGKASFGRHDTRDLATGIEASGPSKGWEFGDTMNLDVSGTLLSAIARGGLRVPLDVDYPDLQVAGSPSTSPPAPRW